jgi:predicted RNA polymerase sigma factor
VARRSLIDRWRSESARRSREEALAVLEPVGDPRGVEAEPGGLDDTLLLLYLCCHPALSPPSQLALTLRAVGGLTTAEIAAAFLVPEATMAQRISRAKQRIKSAGARFELPPETERSEAGRGPSRALPDLQRGVHVQLRPRPAPRRSHQRSDPTVTAPAPHAAG